MNDEKRMTPSEDSYVPTPENIPQEDSGTSGNPAETETGHEKNTGKKKKRPFIIAIIAAVVVVAIILVFAPWKSGTSTGSSNSSASSISAKIADDGTAYIATPDGSVIVINDEVASATLTSDQKHIVVHLDDGTLYFTDKTQQEKTQIADNASSFDGVRNDGFFYKDDDSKAYRVTFSDAATVEMGENIVWAVAKNTLSVLYSTDTGDIYTMPYTATEGNKVGTYSNSVYMEAISDDGQISVWTLKDDNQLTMVLNEGDERTTLGTVDNSYYFNFTNVTFTSDQKLVVVTNLSGNQVYIKKAGEDVVKVKLSNELSSSTIYTNMGILSNQTSDKVDDLYVTVESDSGSNLYNITLDGEHERVLSKTGSYYIANDQIVYIDTDSNLHCAKLSGSSVSDERKIASDVNLIQRSENGGYVYFMKDIEDNSGSLYCYKVGESEAKKVAADVCRYFQFGADGGTVYYLKDIERVNGTYIDYGVLYSWAYSKDESVKISSDVIEMSLNSALVSGEIDDKGFTYRKYSSVDSDKNLYVDLYCYNGKESSKMATDVLR